MDIPDALIAKTPAVQLVWCLGHRMMDKNPLVRMAEVNGYLVDLRDMPREVQEIAFGKGVIPYIPDCRE